MLKTAFSLLRLNCRINSQISKLILSEVIRIIFSIYHLTRLSRRKTMTIIAAQEAEEANYIFQIDTVELLISALKSRKTHLI